MTRIRERNRALILSAASEQFAQKGFSAAKTADIAAQAGVPKPSVYYYFKNKQALYTDVLESVIEPMLQAGEHFHKEGVPSQVLSRFIRAKVQLAQELPSASKVLAGEIMHGAHRLRPEQRDRLHRQELYNIACLTTWIDRGLIAPIEPRHLLFTIYAASQNYVDINWQQTTGPGEILPDEPCYELITQNLLRMILKACELDPVEPQP